VTYKSVLEDNTATNKSLIAPRKQH